MKRLLPIFLLLLVPLLTQCEDREQRMLFDAAQRTEKDNPSAYFTEEAYSLSIRFLPGTKLAKEAEARIEVIRKRREEGT